MNGLPRPSKRPKSLPAIAQANPKLKSSSQRRRRRNRPAWPTSPQAPMTKLSSSEKSQPTEAPAAPKRLLDGIGSPADIKALREQDLPQLAQEVRDELIKVLSQTGGHLGPNLGVVELTVALHRVFDSPTDKIVFDTGHQAYVHKILTGRAAGFDSLRQENGLSGYPSRAESEHDVVENSHASTALSYA